MQFLGEERKEEEEEEGYNMLRVEVNQGEREIGLEIL